MDLPDWFAPIILTMKRSVAAFREAEVPYLLAGSLACWARGGPPPGHDLDFVVKPDDAERAQRALVEAGMRAETPPEGWLLKVWDDDVLVDVIFAPTGLEVTDEMLARGDELRLLAITTRVMALDDVLASKLLALDEHALDFGKLLGIARAVREQVDWEALRARTGHSPFAQAFFTLAEGLAIAPPR